MTAMLALQSALVGQLERATLLSGVYHDVPVRAEFPYAALNCGDEKDWSCKGRQGREIALEIMLWDDQPSRLLETESEVERGIRAVQTGPQWHLSTFILVGKRRSRTPGGAWSCLFELRARLIERAPGAAV